MNVLIALTYLCVSSDRKYSYRVDQDEFWKIWAEKRRGAGTILTQR